MTNEFDIDGLATDFMSDVFAQVDETIEVIDVQFTYEYGNLSIDGVEFDAPSTLCADEDDIESAMQDFGNRCYSAGFDAGQEQATIADENIHKAVREELTRLLDGLLVIKLEDGKKLKAVSHDFLAIEAATAVLDSLAVDFNSDENKGACDPQSGYAL